MDIWLEDRGPDLLVDAQVRIVDEINSRLMARGGKRMAHFLVYNEPNLVPFFYHSLDRYPVERKGPEYLLPAFDTMLAHYVKAYDGIHDLFEARGWGTPQVGFTIASLCAYEYDKQLDDLLRLRSWGVAREDAAAKIAECRTAWRARIDDLAQFAADRRAVRPVPRDDRDDRRHAAAPSGSRRRWMPCTRRPARRSSTTCRSTSTSRSAARAAIPTTPTAGSSGSDT